MHCFRASVKYRPFFSFAHFLFSGRWRRGQRWRTGKRVRTFWLSRGGRVLTGRVFFRNWNQWGRVRWESDFCFDVKLNLAQVKRAMGYKLDSPKLMPLLEWKVLVWRDRCRFERRLRINRKRLGSLWPERVLGTLQVFFGCCLESVQTAAITSTMCFNPQYSKKKKERKNLQGANIYINIFNILLWYLLYCNIMICCWSNPNPNPRPPSIFFPFCRIWRRYGQRRREWQRLVRIGGRSCQG